MLARLVALTLLSSLVFAQQNQNQIDPLKRESENVGRKHDATAPQVQAVQPVQREEKVQQPPRKVYSPIERKSLNLSITRAKSIVEERKTQEGQVGKGEPVQGQSQSQPQPQSQSQSQPEPIKGVCVLQEEVRVRNFRHFAEMPCLVIYPESKVVRARAVFEPDVKNFVLRGRIVALDGKAEDLVLLRSGSENLPVEVKKFLLANAFVGAGVKTVDDVSKIVQDASRAEVKLQIGGSGLSANVGFAEVLKRLPTVAGILATGNLLRGLATAIAPTGQIPPEFILPAGTELYFSRP